MSRRPRLRALSALLAFAPASALAADAIPLPSDACTIIGEAMSSSAIGLPNGGARVESMAMLEPTALVVAERGPTPAARVTPAAPAACRIVGRILPVDPAAPPIRFQVNLPAQWNGKAVQFGGGGFNGILITGLGLVPGAPFDRPGALARGYITYGTDSGHEQKPGELPQAFAANDEAFENFAHAAYKKVRDVAVTFAERAYGRKPSRVYFVGSSEGGREALTMAQRYPVDFDGVFARVPVINWTALQHAGLRNGLATRGEAWLAPAQVRLVAEAVLDTCDTRDGSADRVVADTTGCLRAFDVATLRCAAGQPAETCLNDAQIKAVQTLRSPWRSPFPLANGVAEYPGWGIGGEAIPASGPTGGWSAWFVGTSPPAMPPQPSNGIAWVYGSGAIQHVFMRDPKGDVATYAPDAHRSRVEQVSGLIDSTNPDLSAFRARGGKVIILEYMADYAQSPYAGIGYYESVVERMGEGPARDLIRLFTAPGVDHVGTGAPAHVDMLSALETWVESGIPPAGLAVSEQELAAPDFRTLRTLPLCEWPTWPRYREGDQARAESYECVR